MGHISGELLDPDRKELLARIPALPPIVLRLLDLLASKDVEIRELAALISSDPAFATQIVQVANSPLFGFHSQIDSLQSAIVMLGLRRVRAITLTLAISNHMKAALRVEELSRCWRHMVACALLTDELARCCAVFEDRAYAAGLLHDLGRLGLLLAYPDEYAELLRSGAHNAHEFLDCERKSLGVDHCEAGRALAADWSLPLDFRVVAAQHHNRQDNSAADLLTLVQLGCRLADSLGFWVVEPLEPTTAEEILAGLPRPLAQRIRIDAPHWRELVERHIRCYGDPEGAALDSLPEFPEPACEVIELQGDQLAKLRFPDPNESSSLPIELIKLVVIGLFFTLLIVGLVYLAVK